MIPALKATGKPGHEVRTFTPEECVEILARSKGANFRALRVRHVTRLANMMVANQWEVNGSCIVLNHLNVCVDGQHRLSACVQAGVPFTSLVMYGVRSVAHLDVDSLPRTESDYAAAAGLKYASAIVSALRNYAPWEAGVRNIQAFGNWRIMNMNHGSFSALIETHGAAMVRLADPMPDRPLISPLNIMFIGRVIEVNGGNVSKFTDMAKAVNSGSDLRAGSAPLGLHNRLTRNKADRIKLRSSQVTELIIRAWNAHARNQHPFNLTLSVNANAPEIELGL